MITTNRLPLLKRSRLRPVINYDIKNKRYGSLLIMNTMENKDLKNKLGIVNIDYNSVITMCYTKRRESIKIKNKMVTQNRINERQAYYDLIKKELPMLTGINEGKLNVGYNMYFDLVNANTIFINNSSAIIRVDKPNMYWDFINRYLQDLPLDKYPIKSMIINADEFGNDLITDFNNRGDGVNPIAYLYILMKREPEKFYNIGDIDILITSKSGWIMRVNPSECKRLVARENGKVNIATSFRKEIFRMLNKQDPEENNVMSELDNELNTHKEEISKSLIDKFVFGATGDENIPEEVKNKIEIEVEKIIDQKRDANEVEIKKELEQNTDLMKDLLMANNKGISKSTASSKRDELLREKQMEINIRGKSFEEILNLKCLHPVTEWHST